MFVSLLLALALSVPDLRPEITRESLTGTHTRLRQYIDGLPVVGGEVNATVRRDGTRSEVRALASTVEEAPVVPRNADLVWVNEEGVARLARRESERDVIRYVAIRDARVLRREELSMPAKPARVFDPNPVAKLGAPGLRDESDSASAVPPNAYTDVMLDRVRESGPLGGPAVQIADAQGPLIPPVDASSTLIFDRSESGFEDVNAYFHIDRTQQWLQTLGYVGPRAIAPYAIETDTHAVNGADDSFFIALPEKGKGRLFFGEGGTDDAEDSDLLVHEYGHAIHEWISPGTFLGSFNEQARAAGEGFGDYLAFSAKYAAARASGSDPHCIADWDARCWTDPASERCAYAPGSECLRRTDGAKTIADLLHGDTPGVEHQNGEIWSAALAEIFIALTQRYGIERGRIVADTLAVESLFGTPSRATFATIAKQMIVADRFLSGGANGDVICAAMTRRGILTDCLAPPRGEFTIFPGSGSGSAIPDNNLSGITLSTFVSDTRAIEKITVSADISHPIRGELRVSLIAPDGTVVRLHEPSFDRAPDIRTTYGREALPIDSLDVFRGRSGAGEWRLRISDIASVDVGTVVSWSLNIQFEGEEPSAYRPYANAHVIRQIIPIAGHTPGANGTFFRTDLRLFNPSAEPRRAEVIFTPSGRNGWTDFTTVRILLPPRQVVALDDVVARTFLSGGTGFIEVISSDVVLASSRTSTNANQGSFGFGLRSTPSVSITAGDREYVAGLRNTAAFRTNLGFVETRGVSTRVHVTLRGGTARETFVVEMQPLSHLQIPTHFAGDPFLAEISTEGGWIVAYGAVVDNRTGDAMVIPSKEADGGGEIFPAISAPGGGETHWRTEVSVVSVDAATGLVEHSYREGADPFVRIQRQSAFERVVDAVQTWFGRTNSIGTIISNFPTNLLVNARVWTSASDGGTYGDHVSIRNSSSQIFFIENSDRYRTNVGFYRFQRTRARATLFDSDGNVVRTFVVELEPFQLVQIPITDRIVNGRLSVEGASAYAALVDNESGDLVFIP